LSQLETRDSEPETAKAFEGRIYGY